MSYPNQQYKSLKKKKKINNIKQSFEENFEEVKIIKSHNKSKNLEIKIIVEDQIEVKYNSQFIIHNFHGPFNLLKTTPIQTIDFL